MKYTLCIIAGIVSAQLIATDFPERIDFHEHPFIDTYFHADGTWTKKLADEAHAMGLIALNEGPEMGVFFRLMQKEYGINTAIETGTHQGFTASFLGNWFEEVHTIEVLEKSYQKALTTFGSRPNIQCHLGSAEIVLETLLPTLSGKPVIFYLDAHWEQHWPLLEELEIISKTHKDNCIIVIDDVQVPGRPDLHYDQYGSDICRLEYFEKGLNQVFTEYSSHYLIPRNSVSRAKYVAIPKQFRGVIE